MLKGEKPDIYKRYKKVCPGTPVAGEFPISDVYPVIDTDLARDNLENHIPAADLQDLNR